MSPEREEATRLGLLIESDYSPLQVPRPGCRGLLAAVYPHAARIVLFERNIQAFCRSNGVSVETKREALIRHELHHYREWRRCRRAGRRWHPRDPGEEQAARRAENPADKSSADLT